MGGIKAVFAVLSGPGSPWWFWLGCHSQVWCFVLFAWLWLVVGAYAADKPWAAWLFFDANKERLCGLSWSWLWCF